MLVVDLSKVKSLWIILLTLPASVKLEVSWNASQSLPVLSSCDLVRFLSFLEWKSLNILENIWCIIPRCLINIWILKWYLQFLRNQLLQEDMRDKSKLHFDHSHYLVYITLHFQVWEYDFKQNLVLSFYILDRIINLELCDGTHWPSTLRRIS